MAHNIHIPWTLLSSHFKFAPTSRKHNGQTNLCPRYQPKQGSELMHFSRVFAQTISSFSAAERSKYSSPITPPDPNEVIISEHTAKNISKTVAHYRTTNLRLVGRTNCQETCSRSRNFGCHCPLSPPERQMSIWISELDCTLTTCRNCCCYTYSHSDTLELARTLLLYGEMETLLRIAAHPNVHLTEKWNVHWACGGGFGIAELMRCALMSYIFLNLVYLHPETWEAEAKGKWMAEKRKSGMVAEEKEVDYRKTVSWEKVVSRCTGRRQYDVHTYPHRLFFGISEHDYNGNSWRAPGCGRQVGKHPSLQSEEERRRGKKYLPVSEDVDIVLFYLCRKGFPTEIGLQILAYANFKTERRLPIANDPLDPRNREELRKYLSWCWKTLVRCDVLMAASGGRIEWVYEITDVIKQLWGTDGQSKEMFRWPTSDEEQAEIYEEIEDEMRWLSLPDRKVIFK